MEGENGDELNIEADGKENRELPSTRRTSSVFEPVRTRVYDQCVSSSAASLSTRSSITSLCGRPCPAAAPAASPPTSCCCCPCPCPSNAAPVFTGTSGALRGSNPG